MVKVLHRWIAALSLLILFAVVGPAATGADDKAERDRKARVALALAGPGRPTIAAAPMPRAATKDYPAGYRAATADQQVLVVFVGCDAQPVKDAIACKCDAPTFADVAAPAVVVGYPVGDRLMIDARLKGCPGPAELKKAVEAAQRKIDAPPATAMPAPKPLTWDIRADAEEQEFVGFRRRAAAHLCPCGDSCECAAGSCPAKCPATAPQKGEVRPAEVRAPAPVAPQPITYREVWYTDGRRTWRVYEPIAPISSAATTQTYTLPGAYSGSCPNGRCPNQR